MYAQVRVPSPLPALDKEFDYLIPSEIAVQFGYLVKVPFGKGGKFKTGVVVGISETSPFASAALPIDSVLSRHPVITIEQLKLAELLADRYVGSVGEILHSMIPTRSIRVENDYIPASMPHIQETPRRIEVHLGERVYIQPKLISASEIPDWAEQFVEQARSALARSESSLIVLPDFRDLAVFELALERAGLSSMGIRHSSSDKNSFRYQQHLRSINELGIVYGLRSTVIAPVKNLGLIMVLDDGDESHFEQSAPYWNVRDVALLRQNLDSASLIFSSNSPSAEVVRLVELNYLKHVKVEYQAPLGRISTSASRLDDETYALVSRTLKESKPVLVQIANLGYANALACRKCGQRRVCESCGGGIWVDTHQRFRCRNCKRSGPLPSCECGGEQVKPIRIGSSAMSDWLAKAFPDANVIHSSAEDRVGNVTSGATLVIATPGAEPAVSGGYAAVILADAGVMLGYPSLRALENSALKWANACSKASQDAVIVFVGLVGDTAKQAFDFDFYGMVQSDFLERQELALPPSSRLVSIACKSKADLDRLIDQCRSELGSKIREVSAPTPDKFAFCFEYSNGKEIASKLKEISETLSKTSKTKKPGQRLYKIAMDDWQVL